MSPATTDFLRRRLCAATGSWLLVALLLLVTCMPARAAGTDLELRDSTAMVDVWPHVRILPEGDAPFALADVLLRMSQFREPETPRANLGLRREGVWLHIPVDVPATESGRWILDLDYPSLDRVDAYVITDGRAVHSVRLGDELALAERPLPGRTHAVELVLERGQRHDLLLRVQTTSTMIVPITLMQPRALNAREASVQAGQGLFAGVWLCLLLYSLAQWASLRDPMFAAYALSICGTGMFFVGYFGLGPQHLWPASPWLTQNVAPMVVLLALVGGLLFVERAMDVRSTSPRLAKAVRLLAAVSGVSALLFVAGLISYRAAHTIATVLGPSPMLLAVPVAFVRWRAGDRAAGYMLAGWGAYAVGVVVMAALLRGHMPTNFWTQHAFQFGSTAEMVLWMMVLGVRVDEIRAAAERAHRERDRLRSLAHTDALTGLLNRRGLQSAVESVLGKAGAGRVAAVYLLDLDGFKPVNDTHGHDVGDELLVGVARRLQGQVRASDPVARIGGDEFVLVATGLATEVDAERLGIKLLAAFKEPFAVAGTTCRVGLTVGYALAPHDGRELASLLKRADAAMYAGKQAGKGKVLRGAASAGLSVDVAAT